MKKKIILLTSLSSLIASPLIISSCQNNSISLDTTDKKIENNENKINEKNNSSTNNNLQKDSNAENGSNKEKPNDSLPALNENLNVLKIELEKHSQNVSIDVENKREVLVNSVKSNDFLYKNLDKEKYDISDVVIKQLNPNTLSISAKLFVKQDKNVFILLNQIVTGFKEQKIEEIKIEKLNKELVEKLENDFKKVKFEISNIKERDIYSITLSDIVISNFDKNTYDIADKEFFIDNNEIIVKGTFTNKKDNLYNKKFFKNISGFKPAKTNENINPDLSNLINESKNVKYEIKDISTLEANKITEEKITKSGFDTAKYELTDIKLIHKSSDILQVNANIYAKDKKDLKHNFTKFIFGFKDSNFITDASLTSNEISLLKDLKNKNDFTFYYENRDYIDKYKSREFVIKTKEELMNFI
ncbi:hypothetical protein [Mycoplasmopsis alligatoris]|uniref:Lipoprotein n=1 Tax=Mycoplasmopsis alligatoris A21JP2 TaxID=747682 RepID=D4XWA4_9BACT|nr:hypothetical protein [Mycoplasmopsis alligatoris]EFF41375.1 hypothetical protein MALL_0060 [Mycoplasmopsis alligatoris A21JP2]